MQETKAEELTKLLGAPPLNQEWKRALFIRSGDVDAFFGPCPKYAKFSDADASVESYPEYTRKVHMLKDSQRSVSGITVYAAPPLGNNSVPDPDAVKQLAANVVEWLNPFFGLRTSYGSHTAFDPRRFALFAQANGCHPIVRSADLVDALSRGSDPSNVDVVLVSDYLDRKAHVSLLDKTIIISLKSLAECFGDGIENPELHLQVLALVSNLILQKLQIRSCRLFQCIANDLIHLDQTTGHGMVNPSALYAPMLDVCPLCLRKLGYVIDNTGRWAISKRILGLRSFLYSLAERSLGQLEEYSQELFGTLVRWFTERYEAVSGNYGQLPDLSLPRASSNPSENYPSQWSGSSSTIPNNFGGNWGKASVPHPSLRHREGVTDKEPAQAPIPVRDSTNSAHTQSIVAMHGEAATNTHIQPEARKLDQSSTLRNQTGRNSSNINAQRMYGLHTRPW